MWPLTRKILSICVICFLLGVFSFEIGYANHSLFYDEPNFDIAIGACSWNGSQSITAVTFSLTNTKVQIYPPSGPYFPLTMSRPIVTAYLESGIYRYVWWDDYYPGSGTWLTPVEDFFTLPECIPQAAANITTQPCNWDATNGSVTPVIITLDHAKLSLNGIDYTNPLTTITNLPPGTYSYSWVGTDGYQGGESGKTLVVPDCTPLPASASVIPGSCTWDSKEGSSTDVELNISNASLTITGPDGNMGPYISSTTLTLDPGAYNYHWTALPGYSGSGSGSFNLIECEPGKGNATVSAGACVWDEQEGSTFTASITVVNSSLMINGGTYIEDTDLKLPCGTYPYTWKANEGYLGGGDSVIEVEGCEPASVNIAIGACEWIKETPVTPVTLTINGATLVLKEGEDTVGTYGPHVHSVELPTGSYTYTWLANEDFTGSGSGSFDTLYCEPGKSGAAVSVGACTYDNRNSLTAVTVTVSNAILTIDGQEYIETAELKLLPGEYPYSWVSVDDSFTGSGEGVLSITSCQPKESVNGDPTPDVAAGGSGPSLLASLTPFVIGLSGAGAATTLIVNRKKETHKSK